MPLKHTKDLDPSLSPKMFFHVLNQESYLRLLFVSYLVTFLNPFEISELRLHVETTKGKHKRKFNSPQETTA